MHLPGQKTFLFAAALTLGCHESTAPPSPIAGYYVLKSINNQPLPANIVASDGDTITVLSSSLGLSGTGQATLFERLRIVHPGSPAHEVIQTTGYVYRITEHSIAGDDVTFDYSPPCPINALCVAPPTANVVGLTLILSYGDYSGARPPSLYRRMGLD